MEFKKRERPFSDLKSDKLNEKFRPLRVMAWFADGDERELIFSRKAICRYMTEFELEGMDWDHESELPRELEQELSDLRPHTAKLRKKDGWFKGAGAAEYKIIEHTLPGGKTAVYVTSMQLDLTNTNTSPKPWRIGGINPRQFNDNSKDHYPSKARILTPQNGGAYR